ncbi:SprT-like family-domain-containing protein [Flagelloscypha sp. PMI_526]|nr:SprT-like family-domain-containing protein [Flagelloscypha sp. PMI_526]
MTAPVTPKAKKRIVQPHKVIEILSSDEESQEVPTKFTQTPTKNRAGGTVTPSRSKAVHVVNLRRASSSDDASPNQQYTVLDKGKGRAKHTPSNRRVSRFADGPGSSADEAVSTDEGEVGSLMSTPKRPMTTAARGRIISRERSMTSDPSPERSASTASPKTPSPTKKQLPPSPSKTPPMKKGSDWRIQFAQDLYKSFNEEIFGGELPSDTPLIWNARYKSTAGRATYARNRLGEVKELRIDLSPKLLDDEDRIRFTLCHEMCHLASWMITEDDDQGHGEVFKKWAARAMRIRKDVVISMRHSYKINYSWEWSCVNCSWTHGRWTNSVDTEEWGESCCSDVALASSFG